MATDQNIKNKTLALETDTVGTWWIDMSHLTRVFDLSDDLSKGIPEKLDSGRMVWTPGRLDSERLNAWTLGL